MNQAKTAYPKKRKSKKSKDSPWMRLKVSLSKNLFDDSITEIRTLQNEVIGTVSTVGARKYQVTNYRSDRVELSTFKDSKQFVLKSYFFAGKPMVLEKNLQLNLF